MKNSYLEDLLRDGAATAAKIQEDFSDLSKPQLDWKPNQKSWSIAQCLDHLITTNILYFPILKDITNGTQKTNFWQKLPFSKMWGNMIKGTVDPNNAKTSDSPKEFKPSQSDIQASIVADFEVHFQEMSKIIRATDKVNHDTTILSSPAAKFITYSLKDACIIIVTHLERHYRQAKRVKESEGFPKLS